MSYEKIIQDHSRLGEVISFQKDDGATITQLDLGDKLVGRYTIASKSVWDYFKCKIFTADTGSRKDEEIFWKLIRNLEEKTNEKFGIKGDYLDFTINYTFAALGEFTINVNPDIKDDYLIQHYFTASPFRESIRQLLGKIRGSKPLRKYTKEQVGDNYYLWDRFLSGDRELQIAKDKYDQPRYSVLSEEQDELFSLLYNLFANTFKLRGFSVGFIANNPDEALDKFADLTLGVKPDEPEEETKTKMKDPWKVKIPEIKEGLR